MIYTNATYRMAGGATKKFQVRLVTDSGFREDCDVCVAGRKYVVQAFELMHQVCIFSTSKPDSKKIPKTPVIVVPSYRIEDVVSEYASRFKDVLEQAHISELYLIVQSSNGAPYARAIDVAGL